MKPKGELKLDSCKVTHKKSIAVYVDIFLKDETGEIFSFKASSFAFDLEHRPHNKPVERIA